MSLARASWLTIVGICAIATILLAINGYSGYYTDGYVRLLDDLRRPQTLEWLRRLDRIGVRYALVHLGPSPDPQALAVLEVLKQRNEWVPRGTYSGAGDVVSVFERSR